MFGRRRDIQIPKVPVSGDKATQSWMTAVGSMLSKYIGGGSNDRLVSAGELIDGGLAGVGTGGFLTSPPRNLTKPPKVTGLTANGALASIFVGWHNPSFSNYAYTELWRADIDDIGQAVLIASTAVESYTDNVGSAATKYYWARAVSDQGVKGDFNAASGTKGTTSLDPDYVMQVLTSSTWKPNTTYYPFQYVRPTVENGFQYAAVDGGKSGSVEPTWPLSVDPTVITNDGTVQWKCLRIEDRIPFVLGTLEDGTPAVFMDTAYIKNATITSAKIITLIAEKIETGNLIADLQVMNKLWYGFNFPNGVYYDAENNTYTAGKTGFYLGVDGSNGLPVFHLNTGVANGSRSLYFDGTQLKLENIDLVSSADGEFDDLAVDSLTANRAYTTDLGFKNLFAVSDFIKLDAQGRPIINNINVRDYYCWIYGASKKVEITSPYGIIGSGGGLRLQTYLNTGIVPYDYPDSSTKYRMKKKAIAFSAKLTTTTTPLGFYPHISVLRIYIFDDNGFPLNYTTISQSEAQTGYAGVYLAKLDLSFTSDGVVGNKYETQTAYFKNSSGTNLFQVSYIYGGYTSTNVIVGGIKTSYANSKELYITCESDNEALSYLGSRRLKMGVEYELFSNYDVIGIINLQFMLIDNALSFNAINDVFT